MTELTVIYGQHRVGQAITEDEARFYFVYDPDWLTNFGGFPVSVHRSLIRWMISLSPTERLLVTQQQVNAVIAGSIVDEV